MSTPQSSAATVTATTTTRTFTDDELDACELGLKNNLKQAEVNTLLDYYKRKDPHNYGLLPHQFKEAAGKFIAAGLTIDPNVIFNIFDIAETGVHGRVTRREFILGYAILCRGTTENRLRYLFAIYGGSHGVGFLTRDQLVSSLKLMQRIVSKVSEDSDDADGEQDEEHILDVADNLIAETSNPSAGRISYDDFINKIKESDVVMSWLDKLSTVAGEHLKYIERLETDVVQLNMEREGILTSGSPVKRGNIKIQQDMQWEGVAPITSLSAAASPTVTNDKKRKIPMPRKQKVVRRDLRTRRSASEADMSRPDPTEDINDDEINAAKPFLINYDQINFDRILGRGACATVYRATWMHIPVAVKVFNDGQGDAAGNERLSSSDEEMRKSIVGDYVEEFWLLLQIRHPNCLLYMGICFEPVVCIVTELFTGGSVADFLHGPNARRFEPSQAIEMICGVARGMYYLHASSPPILHRDLKASNILINRLVTQCVICDFGLSRQFVSEASGINMNGSQPSDVGHGKSGAGTPYSMAPEVMQHKPYTPAADVYSFGVVMYEMYTGRFPFPKLKPIQLMFRVCEGHRPKFFEEDNVPTTLRKLIEQCWAQDLKDRPTFEDILKVLTSEKLTEEIDAVERLVAVKEQKNNVAVERSGVDLSKRLLDEAYLGRDEELLRLIHRGADVDYCDYDKRTALHVAAAEGQVECMRVLMRAGARLNHDRWNNTPIADAINYANRSGDSEPVRLLRAIEGRESGGGIERSSDLKLGSEAMTGMRNFVGMKAAAEGKVASLRQLLYDGLDVNTADYDRRTPLMVAASEGHRDVVAMLLEHGANLRSRDRWGSTAYHEAERGGHHEVMLLLRNAEERAGMRDVIHRRTTFQ